MDGVDADIQVHVCWGNYMGTPDVTTARAEAIFPRVHRVHISALNYEMAHRGGEDLASLQRGGWDRDFIAGVIDVKSVEIETPETVAERIRACLHVVRPEHLGLSTDCGLINLPRRVAQAKLRSLVDGANVVRAEVRAEPARMSPV